MGLEAQTPVTFGTYLKGVIAFESSSMFEEHQTYILRERIPWAHGVLKTEAIERSGKRHSNDPIFSKYEEGVILPFFKKMKKECTIPACKYMKG